MAVRADSAITTGDPRPVCVLCNSTVTTVPKNDVSLKPIFLQIVPRVDVSSV